MSWERALSKLHLHLDSKWDDMAIVHRPHQWDPKLLSAALLVLQQGRRVEDYPALKYYATGSRSADKSLFHRL